jgi:transposase
LKWWEAAEIIGVTDRTMRRWRERYQEHGNSGLWDYRKRSPSPKRIPVEVLEKVLQLYREKYFDFNVQHFPEKLKAEHGVEQSYRWVKTALQEAGLVERRKKRGTPAATAAAARQDVAPRCQRARLVSGWAPVGVDRDPG